MDDEQIMPYEPAAAPSSSSVKRSSVKRWFRNNPGAAMALVASVAALICYLLNWSIVAALAAIIVAGWLLARASLATHAIGMILVLLFYVLLVFSDQGDETIRSMEELSPWLRFFAVATWVITTAAFSFILADSTRAVLRRAPGLPPTKSAFLVKLMWGVPLAATLFVEFTSHRGGYVGWFEDSIGDGLRALWFSLEVPSPASALTMVALIALYFFATVAFVLDVTIFDRRKNRVERWIDLTFWSIAIFGALFVGLIGVVWVGHLGYGWNIPAPVFLAAWFAFLVGLIAFLQACGRSMKAASSSGLIGVPVVWFLAAAAVILAVFDANDNHELAYRRIRNWQPAPLASEAFRTWLAQKTESNPTVFVVAAEGGGARAAFMTALILDVLRSYCRPFAERHFATIGVSGGSVGAALSAASEANSSGDCRLPSEIDPETSIPAKAAGSDLLDPALRGLLLTDLLLRFVPASLWRHEGNGTFGQLQNSPFAWTADRAQYIEWALGIAWSHATGQEALLGERAFRDFAPRAGSNRPALILLTTDVASGHRIAFSHLRFRSDTPSAGANSPTVVPRCRQPLDEAISSATTRAGLLTFDDIAPGRDATLLAAAVASARFPIITPSATLPCPNARWRVVDGGYFENSGLSTALELFDLMAEGAASAGKEPRIVLIRIENSEATTGAGSTAFVERKVDPPTASELYVPVQTSLATRDARADAARRIVDRADENGRFGSGCKMTDAKTAGSGQSGSQAADSRAVDGNRRDAKTAGVKDCLKFNQVVIKLHRCLTPVPLGWSLSATARREIAIQLGLVQLKPDKNPFFRLEDRPGYAESMKDCLSGIADNRARLQKLMSVASGKETF